MTRARARANRYLNSTGNLPATSTEKRPPRPAVGRKTHAQREKDSLRFACPSETRSRIDNARRLLFLPPCQRRSGEA
jgi:hypothetical protein